MESTAQSISERLRRQIEAFQPAEDTEDVGYVTSVGDGIALVTGLHSAIANELLRFGTSGYGIAFNLEEEAIGVVILSGGSAISAGDEVRRTGRVVEVPVGDGLLGRVVNALGQPIDGGPDIQAEGMRPIDRPAPGVMDRRSVHEPLMTGIKAIDSMIPIGRGQRELIIGDRQTGKTTIAVDTIINQAGKGVKCVYVAIGQKASSVALIVERLRAHGAMDYTVVVNATASELAPLQYIAPYAGCAMAEEWMERGEHVLVIYDDLSKHAVAYRTISLLLRRPPGREAYPGDVFYLHSRLLERAAKLSDARGGGSMTALPIIETQVGDISAYIPTNVISITDGQIFLQTELFNEGRRPAIDTGLSVSRVGGSAQYKAIKAVSASLKLELAQYGEMLAFTQFGSELDDATRATLDHGARLTELFKQPPYSPLTMPQLYLSIYAAKHGYLRDLPVSEVLGFERQLHAYFAARHAALLEDIERQGELTEEQKQTVAAGIATCLEEYVGKGA